MSSVRCPHCQFVLELKRAKPGRYKPICPGCRERFLLIVPDISNAVATAEVISPKVEKKKTRAGVASVRPISTVAVQVAPVQIVKAKPLEMPDVPDRLAGYRVIKKLGQGEMGAVYLARHISIDRNVALKVLSPELTADARFIAPFTREAYAAAQLSHHNIVQIYDIGVKRSGKTSTHFSSMEFIEGQTLALLLKESGKLDPELAVSYILQAARGLKFGHDHGLIHRDIRPANLLLDDHGLVKIADLGLVKRVAFAEVGGENNEAGEYPKTLTVSIEAASFMPPEQSRDPAAVDIRSDVYSLGCTLYELLTHQPPHGGRTAAEIVEKHATQSPVPPERIVKEIPAALSFIVLKMIARSPSDRYQSMSDAIIALQRWLGGESGKPFSPTPEQAQAIESTATRFNSSKWKIVRTICIRAFLVLSTLAIIILAWPSVGYPMIAAGFVGFVLTTIVVYEILLGIAQRHDLSLRFRELIFASSILDWIGYLFVIAGAILMLTAFDLHWLWMWFAVGAIVVAGVFYATVDVMLEKDRVDSLMQTEDLLKELRLRAMDENAVRQFVSKHAGQNWEEFYEGLFGYKAKLLARQAWGQGAGGLLRPRYARWREPIFDWIDRKLQRRRAKRTRKMMARLEATALRAGGVKASVAGKIARSNARRVVEKAAVIRETATLRSAETALPNHARAGTQFNDQVRGISADWMHDDSRPAHEHATRRRRRGRISSPLDVLFGQPIRLVLATLILAGFGMWRNINGGLIVVPSSIDPRIELPLRILDVPTWICDATGSWKGGFIGTLLLISTVFSETMVGCLVLCAALLGLCAKELNLPLLATSDWWAAGVAALFGLIAVLFFRTQD